MPDVGAQIPALVTLIGLIGGGIAFLIRRRDSKKDPIPKESAAVALAQSSVSIMQAVADDLREGLARKDAELATMRADLTALSARQRTTEERLTETQSELADTRTDIDWLRSTLGVAASYIEKLLRWAREDARPPLPALPEKLRTLIDPSLHTLPEED